MENLKQSQLISVVPQLESAELNRLSSATGEARTIIPFEDID
jgi:hypothetical protein